MIHHIEINVSNLKESMEFWGWLLPELGYKEYQIWGKGRSWRKGESYIVFVQTESRFLDIPYHRGRSGLNHLAFYADSRRQVDAITWQLQSRNIEVLYKDKHPYAGGPEHYAVYFEDPDRIKVEVVAQEGISLE